MNLKRLPILLKDKFPTIFLFFEKLYNISSRFSHHLVASWNQGLKVWCVHEELNDGKIASTLLTVYNSWSKLAEAEFGGNQWKIIQTCPLNKWNQRSARQVRRTLYAEKKNYNIIWNNCQYYAKLIFQAGKGDSYLNKYLNQVQMNDNYSEIQISDYISQISETDKKNYEQWLAEFEN